MHSFFTLIPALSPPLPKPHIGDADSVGVMSFLYTLSLELIETTLKTYWECFTTFPILFMIIFLFAFISSDYRRMYVCAFA